VARCLRLGNAALVRRRLGDRIASYRSDRDPLDRRRRRMDRRPFPRCGESFLYEFKGGSLRSPPTARLRAAASGRPRRPPRGADSRAWSSSRSPAGVQRAGLVPLLAVPDRVAIARAGPPTTLRPARAPSLSPSSPCRGAAAAP